MGGEEAGAEEVDFTPQNEPWSVYEIEGSKAILRMRLNVVKVYKTDKNDPMTGKPMYVARSQNIMSIDFPDEKKEY